MIEIVTGFFVLGFTGGLTLGVVWVSRSIPRVLARMNARELSQTADRVSQLRKRPV